MPIGPGGIDGVDPGGAHGAAPAGPGMPLGEPRPLMGGGAAAEPLLMGMPGRGGMLGKGGRPPIENWGGAAN